MEQDALLENRFSTMLVCCVTRASRWPCQDSCPPAVTTMAAVTVRQSHGREPAHTDTAMCSGGLTQ